MKILYMNIQNKINIVKKIILLEYCINNIANKSIFYFFYSKGVLLRPLKQLKLIRWFFTAPSPTPSLFSYFDSPYNTTPLLFKIPFSKNTPWWKWPLCILCFGEKRLHWNIPTLMCCFEAVFKDFAPKMWALVWGLKGLPCAKTADLAQTIQIFK